MGTAKPRFVEDLIAEEIRRMIADAVEDGGIISTAECVKQILTAHPQPGLSRRQIADEVMMAAAAAGIAVEIGPVMREVEKRRAEDSEGTRVELARRLHR